MSAANQKGAAVMELQPKPRTNESLARRLIKADPRPLSLKAEILCVSTRNLARFLSGKLTYKTTKTTQEIRHYRLILEPYCPPCLLRSEVVEYCKTRNLSKNEISRRLNKSRSSVNNILRGNPDGRIYLSPEELRNLTV